MQCARVHEERHAFSTFTDSATHAQQVPRGIFSGVASFG